MTRECARIDDRWRVPDRLWQRLEPMFPVRQRRRKNPGCKPLPWPTVLDGIFYALGTGCRWEAAPREFGFGSNLHRYFQQLVGAAIFARFWPAGLEEDEPKGIDWEWQRIDGAMTKAPPGGGNNQAP
ncbi:MAG: transposase [Gemmataceae bacterium]|nr:transposase [Gemmataceae bacterium]